MSKLLPSTAGRLFGEFSMHRTCPKCEFGVPVNGPTDEISCDRCGETVDVASMIDDALMELRDDPQGERRSGRRYTMGRNGKLTISGFVELREEMPSCLECSVPLTIVDPGHDEKLHCSKCGTSWETFPPPAPLLKRHPWFLQCYDAERPDKEGQVAARSHRGGEVILLGCPNCGATLEVNDKGPRDHGCAYCETRFLIPDAAWEYLHPVRRKRRWFVELSPSAEHPALGPLPRGVREIAASRSESMSDERRELINQKAWIKRHAAAESADKSLTVATSPDGVSEDVVLARFRIVVRCMECGSEVPVNGPVQQVTCGVCSAHTQVARFVGNWIRELEYGYCALPRSERRTVVGGRGLNGETRAQVVDAIGCPSCGQPLPEFAHGSTKGACLSCGAKITTFPAPPWLGDEVVSAVQCIECEMEVAPEGSTPNDSAFAHDPQKTGAAVGAVTFDCLGCGASHPVSAESERICRCPYCDKDQYLPDEFWSRLHPVKVARDWFLAMSSPLIRDQELAEKAARYQLSWNEANSGDSTVGLTSPTNSPEGVSSNPVAWRGHLFFGLKLLLAAGAALLLLRLCAN
ncbi:hypothetical protein KKF84_12845 [Myxococcota bacterium]|nr:hypothetical protein [Myxococcota bacterium]MBU1536204.1 hypothetical protein [Myxococcota bacterium]